MGTIYKEAGFNLTSRQVPRDQEQFINGQVPRGREQIPVTIEEVPRTKEQFCNFCASPNCVENGFGVQAVQTHVARVQKDSA